MKAVLAAQLKYCRALERTGAKGCKDWGDLVELLKVGPSDEATGMDQARIWFAALLNKDPKYPSRPVGELIREAIKKFAVSNPEARRAYRDAQKQTGNDKWSETRRPPSDILKARAERAKSEQASLT